MLCIGEAHLTTHQRFLGGEFAIRRAALVIQIVPQRCTLSIFPPLQTTQDFVLISVSFLEATR